MNNEEKADQILKLILAMQETHTYEEMHEGITRILRQY